MIVEKGHFHFAEKYWGGQGPLGPEVFCRKGILRNFAKFTGKHLCQNLFFNKVASLRLSLIKKETLAQVFPAGVVKLVRTPFYMEQLWWMLLLRPCQTSMMKLFKKIVNSQKLFTVFTKRFILGV